ncbi:hypothetical protein Aca07nite_33810 [Actinoplanes capillaceus]|uniref:Uncharacterized protein n=1 Tax=Actinoplanes campanulatus TaxID=113559 RepID=A0ABQ3WIN9_9ACTN|nr:hypothetical protein [Actinoplanes capillaceus]GID46106.1 hypothetical protein Aca07nite_33810 [Actinoplanes capillaceus]
MSLSGLRYGFRDEYQLQSARSVILLRLADDRQPREYGVLMKLWGQLASGHDEVAESDLYDQLGPVKREAVHGLIATIRTSPEAIDGWIAVVSRQFPYLG